MYDASGTMGWLTTVYCLYGKNRRERVLIPMGLWVLVVFTPVHGVSRLMLAWEHSLSFPLLLMPPKVTETGALLVDCSPSLASQTLSVPQHRSLSVSAHGDIANSCIQQLCLFPW